MAIVYCIDLFDDCSYSLLEGYDVVPYSVENVKKLPKLHRAVWKSDFKKVKTATKGMKMKHLDDIDKEQRWVLS